MGGVGPFPGLARPGSGAVGWRWGGWLTSGKRAAGKAGVRGYRGSIGGLRPDAPGRWWVGWAAGGRPLQLKHRGWGEPGEWSEVGGAGRSRRSGIEAGGCGGFSVAEAGRMQRPEP